MFGWLKNLFFGKNEKPTLERPIITPKVEAEPAPKKETKKKPTATTGRKPASKSVDVDSMTKPQLIEHAKKQGIKVNASLKKADLVKKIKNA
jgi:hypothetical protein